MIFPYIFFNIFCATVYGGVRGALFLVNEPGINVELLHISGGRRVNLQDERVVHGVKSPAFSKQQTIKSPLHILLRIKPGSISENRV